MNISNLDTDFLVNSLHNHHLPYLFPVKDITAENVFYNFLLHHNLPAIWDIGSHKQCGDVFLNGLKKGWSIKSTKIRGKYLEISSSRTSGQITIYDKIIKMKEVEKTIKEYVIFGRKESKDYTKVKYFVYVVDPILFKMNSFEFAEKGKNFVSENRFGVKVEIINSMSGQIWYYLPMKLFYEKNNYVNEICRSGQILIKK